MDDPEPTHYENRLTADLGPLLGLNSDDIRRAELDFHAKQRFPPLRGEEAKQAAARCRSFFDVEAFVQTLVNEINSLGEDTPQESLPRQFVECARAWLVDPHVVFDDSALKLDIDVALVIAIVELLVLGKPAPSGTETFRGQPIADLFLSAPRDLKDKASSNTNSQKSSRAS